MDISTGLAYVLAKIVHASWDVLAEAMNGIRLGDIDPAMALRISWSFRIHRE